MSVREFDDYLTVLRGMLRLGADRREAIASELRDHLDERVAELVRQGLSEREAVRLAIEEFGDAAALAADFIRVFRNSKKRWIMRATAISMCAAAVVAVAWLTLWPGDDRELVVQQAAAQSEGEASGGKAGPGDFPVGGSDGVRGGSGQASDAGPGGTGFGPPQGGGGVLAEAPPTVAERNAKTEEALGKRVDVSLENVPLTEFLTYLAETFGVTSYVDRRALDDAGLGMDAPIGLSLQDVRGNMLLDLALGESGLCYMVRDGIVIVTTPEQMDENLDVRIYNCRDLLGMAGGMMGGMMGGMSAMGGGGAGMMSSGGDGSSHAMGTMPGGMAPMASGMMMPGMGGMGSGAMAPPGGTQPPAPRQRLYENDKAAHLINILQATVDAESWEQVGGPGSIGEYNGLLIVTQTAPIHDKLEKVLNMLREADQKQPGAAVRGSR